MVLPETERPVGGETNEAQETGAANLKSTASIPVQLRRRREAANRCAPLDSGYRDPLDALAASRYAGITYDCAAQVMVVKGYGVRDVLRSAGMKPMRRAAGGFLLDLHRLADAMAALEHADYRVSVREGAV